MKRDKKIKQEQNFSSIHPLGLKGLWEVYGRFAFIRKPSFYIAIVLSIILSLVVIFSEQFNSTDLLGFISTVVETGISLNGGLIGLTLAGLTLMVTFGSEKLLNQIVRISVIKAKETNRMTFSSYQTVVSKFGFAVFVQVLALIILFGYKMCLNIDFSFENEKVNLAMNSIYLGIAVFLILYSLFLVVQMTINIFNISQMNHMVIYSDLVKDIRAKEKEELCSKEDDTKLIRKKIVEKKLYKKLQKKSPITAP